MQLRQDRGTPAAPLFFFRVQYPFDSIQAVFDIFVLASATGARQPDGTLSEAAGARGAELLNRNGERRERVMALVLFNIGWMQFFS